MSSYDEDDYEGNGHLPAVPGDDGVADAASDAADRVFGGRPILRYADRQYTQGKDRDEVELGTRKIFKAAQHYWQPWLLDEATGKQKPGKPLLRKPGHRLPDRDELAQLRLELAHLDDQANWPVNKKGEPMDPWQETRAMLLEDPDTGEQCVFTTSSGGGRSAVMDLARDIQDKRAALPGAAPIIELRWANMDTKHGMKSKPFFKVVKWLVPERDGGGSGKEIAERAVSTREAKQIVDQKQMDDEIPF
jgi:hypothetical protein